MNLHLPEWASLLEAEYLAEFVPSGGSSVKIVVAEPPAISTVLDAVENPARNCGFAVARLDGANTRLQFIEHIFFAVARQTDWIGLAQTWLRSEFDRNGLAIPRDFPLDNIEEVARQSGVSARELAGEVRRWIANGISQDVRLSREFRTAMAMLCQSVLNPHNVSPTDADTLVCWLRGERFSASTLKKLHIFTRIGRSNARLMLSSLVQWHRINGASGLVLLLDARAIWSVPSPDAPPGTLRYTRGATLDFYEVLRQWIDDDETGHFLLVVGAPPELWSDPKKGVSQYSALQMRVADEVRDRERANPLGAAVRLHFPVEVGGAS